MRTKATDMMLVFLVAALVAPAALGGADRRITKCQDASGRWHYGDTAADECARSRITELDERGVTVKEIGAAPTKEQIEAREEQKRHAQEERKRAAAQKERDERLLATYENEEAIIRARDQRVGHINETIQINRELSNKLQGKLDRLKGQARTETDKKASAALARRIARTEARIAEYKAANKEKIAEREKVKEKYNIDLARYRRITRRADAPGPSSSGRNLN